MNNMDFEKLLNNMQWDLAEREAYEFWMGGPTRQRRLIIALLRELLNKS
jgi:hypothetical protein